MHFDLFSAIFLSVLCDNLLLTVVVPILPELLRENDDRASEPYRLSLRNDTDFEKKLKEIFHLQMLNENSQLGLLFSTKAIMQLVCNPFVGNLTIKIGYKIPLCLGNLILFLCSLATIYIAVFGFADSYFCFLIGRSFHGLASSLIMISGMALIAELYQDNDSDRTKFLGRVMGAAALGVLIGYPFGGFCYEIFGKSSPFICISLLALFNTVLHAYKIHTSCENDGENDDGVNDGPGPDYGEYVQQTSKSYLLAFIRKGSVRKVKRNAKTLSTTTRTIDSSTTDTAIGIPIANSTTWNLLKDVKIIVISMSIWLSTMSMSILEPTLPVWLISNLDPPKWQLGLIFVPDSLGYFLGTNFFGQFSRRHGRARISCCSLICIGSACFILPMSRHLWQLVLPHFTLGLGLGIVDASLMPLLAKIADETHHASYGSVYALAQTSVALAYSVGPIVGGESVRLVGFPNMIRSVGFLNLIFSPFVVLFLQDDDGGNELESPTEITEINTNSTTIDQQQQQHYILKDFQFLKKYLSTTRTRTNDQDREIRVDGEVHSTYRRFNDDFESD